MSKLGARFEALLQDRTPSRPKTLDQPTGSGDFAAKPQATWGMLVVTRDFDVRTTFV